MLVIQILFIGLSFIHACALIIKPVAPVVLASNQIKHYIGLTGMGTWLHATYSPTSIFHGSK